MEGSAGAPQRVRHVQEVLHVSQRRVCRALGQPRSSQRYVALPRNGEKELTEMMRRMALRHPRYGYRRVTVLLRREGWRINRKRVHRLWLVRRLSVPQRWQERHPEHHAETGAGDGAVQHRHRGDGAAGRDR